jgi:hypothetical protein
MRAGVFSLLDGKCDNAMFSIMVDLTTVCVKFPPDDLEILDALERFERLKRSDIVRRAVRAYAAQLGVQAEQESTPKRRKPKP